MELENECADVVAGKGYQAHQNPTSQKVAEARATIAEAGDSERAPDYLIEGHVFHCYAPTPHKPVRGIWGEVTKKVDKGQTQRVVLNLTDWRGSVGDLQKQFGDWPVPGLKEPVPGLKELVAVAPNGSIIQIVKQDQVR